MRPLALLLATTVAGCRETSPPAYAVTPPRVQVAALAVGELEERVVLDGQLASPPGELTELASLEQGYVARYLVAEGDRVTAGQRLVEISPGPSMAQLEAERARLAEARARDAEAKAHAARVEELNRQGAASSREQEAAAAAAGIGEAGVKEAQAAVDVAEHHLARTAIRAPFDGVVLKLLGSLGQAVSGGQPLLQLANLNQLELHALATPAQAARLTAGQPAELGFEAPGAATAPIRAHLVAVAPSIELPAGAVRVRVALDGPLPSGVRFGSVGRATVDLGTRGGLLLAPLAALDQREGSPEAALLVLDGDRRHVSRRSVTLGPRNETAVAVASGAKAGEQIVVAGGYGLPDGAEVEVGDRR